MGGRKRDRGEEGVKKERRASYMPIGSKREGGCGGNDNYFAVGEKRPFDVVQQTCGFSFSLYWKRRGEKTVIKGTLSNN